ncbi:hypothetical protein Salmuc_01754 [Salipiger mucosus DSM 16094]|uniref:Uncharacterized protein n=2 Tax=Salipiger mucosus TaxID=263378 RepID=S9SCL5_9RHOB|nr:hypothetical protein Salmuc_01754 [Salipiger mucosus DSM 16094]
MRKRLTRAGRLLEDRSRTLEQVSAQATGAPEEAGGSEQYVRLAQDIQRKTRALEDANRTIESLRRENQRLTEVSESRVMAVMEELSDARSEIETLEQAIETLRSSTEVPAQEVQIDLWNELIRSSQHTAGLEAQISAMRRENAHSALLQYDDQTGKSQLRDIYDDAFRARGDQFSQSPEPEQEPVSQGEMIAHHTSDR